MKTFIKYCSIFLLKIKAFVLVGFVALFSQNIYAACGGTAITWAGATNNWSTASNWSGSNVPNLASEDVIIINTGVNARMTVNNTVVGCVDVQSGVFEGTQNRKITLMGDYFKAPYSNTLNLTSNAFKIEMGGTTAQTFEAVDDIRDLLLSNPSSVTLKNTFRIRSDFIISGTGITYVEGHVTLNRTNGSQTIPAGHTLIVKNGATLYARGGLIVDGILKVEGGGTLMVRNNEVLTVSSTGTLQLLGSSGNPAKLASDGANKYYTFNMAGTLTADQFQITRPTGSGINITGTLTQMDNGELRGVNDSAYLMTIASSATMPSTMDAIGFFNDDASASPGNIDASAYTGSVITITNFSGDIADTTYENDPSAKITWSTPSPTELSIVNDAEAGDVQTFMDPGDEFTFAEYSFSITQADTATDITEVKVTMSGTGSLSDLEYVRAYLDSGAGCNWGVADSQIGSDLAFTGSPPVATVTLSAGDMTTSGPTNPAKCLHIRAKASANPTDQKTIEFEISSTADVTNSQSYPFSATSGPPVGTEASIIRNPNFSSWNGSIGTSWADANNWTGGVPGTTRNCTIGVGTNKAIIDVNPGTCSTATLQTNGEIDWNSTANKFEVYGGLDVQSSFIFTAATSGVIEMKGSSNQSFSLGTTFPGNIIINNSGGVGANIVNVTGNSTINGNLTCTQGRIDIPSGISLSVLGNVTIQTGCELLIGAGGMLELGNNSTVTVNSGGTLTVVGTSSSSAKITTTSTANAMNIVVNGTIKAQYYIFERLATTGVSIEAGATIDATYYMQNGSFLYPRDNSSTLLFLKRQIPGNSLASMVFDDGGSGATGVTNINTNGAAAATLDITSYSGNLSGFSFENAPTYLINWTGATNTIDLTQEAVSPTSVSINNTYNMGRFGFQQTSAGASFSDTDITSFTLTLTGTGTAADIQAARLFVDADCDGAGGTQVGTGTFSGLPPKITYSLNAGDFTVEADVSTPPKRCVYVEYDIASGATNGNTVGAKINASNDFTDSQGYGIASGTPAPVDLGSASLIDAPTTTIWTGSTSTVWTDATNWSAGLPSSSKTCEIPNVTNDPVISSGTAVCDDVNITTGVLTLNVGAVLQAYGDFTNNGTFTQNGSLEIHDAGGFANHIITSVTTLANLNINKSGSGNIYVVDTDLTINSVVINNTGFVFQVQNGNKLILPNGFNVTGGEFKIWGGGVVEIGSGNSLQITGGTLKIVGTNDTFPQSSSNKGFIGPQGGTGSWALTATSGTLNITGFQFDKLDNNGLNIGGSTVVSNLNGGQLTNLSASYASMKAIQINTTGSIPVTANNIAWTWGAFNSFDPANANTPVEADAYTLVSSTGCSSQTIDFTGWTGDWYESQATFDVSSKVSSSGCTISLGASSSSIALASYTATAYNGAVDLKWETNLESNHLGFNVYRSNSLANEFEQINETILKNFNNAGQAKGKYRFIDNDVTNDQKYYYYIEDIELAGKRTLHGPRTATPLASLGTPPADAPDENSGGNTDDGDDGGGSGSSTINNPSYRDLGNGVVIHSQTSSTLRLEINPAVPVFTTSSWDGSYEDVSITGYSKMTTAGSPALPERILLIEVYEFATTANLIGSASITINPLAGHKISPTPDYTIDGNGDLVASYNPNGTIYSTNADTPNEYFNIEPNLISTSGKKYLRIKLNPLKFNPTTDLVTHATKIILDIGLDGATWNPSPPTSGSIINPFNVANTLKIDYTKSGMYQLDYNDLVDSVVEGPFDGVSVSNLRLYIKGDEYPIEIYSPSGNFSSGDYLRFYLPFTESLDDIKNTAILSPIEISDTSSSVKRITNVDANPSGIMTATLNHSLFSKTFEQNLTFISGEPLGDGLDHFFWGEIASYSGGDELTITANLPELDSNSDYNVRLKFHVKGQLGYFGNYCDHHVSVFVGGVEEEEITFYDNERRVLQFEVPADRFIAGNNTIKLKVNGTYAPSGDYDRVFVDKLVVEYVGDTNGGNGHSKFILEETLVAHTINNLSTNNINVYDITSSTNTKSLINSSISGTGPYNISFVPDDELDENGEKVLLFVETGSFNKPIGLSLSPGFPESLKLTSNGAKLIVIGDRALLEAASSFIAHKNSLGVSVKAVTPDQIFGEFSDGKTSAKAIKDFINYALDNWSTKPSYVFLIGDGTFDPKNYNIDGNAAGVITSTQKETLPMPYYTGRFIDFGADNYFVTNEVSNIPRVAIGRLPTNDPDKVEAYGQKVIDYENSQTIPVETRQKHITFIADVDLYAHDRFMTRTNRLMSYIPNFETTTVDRTALGDNASTLTQINSEFNNAPYIMSFMGHGANDRFGNGIFRTNEAQALSNSTLPITLTWNCETAYYYDPNRNTLSLGEELVLQKNGGSIVFMGSTTQTTPTAQEKLAQSFFTILNNEISSHYTGESIGDIFHQAKLSLGNDPYTMDILNSHTLLGDPSVKIPSSMFAPAPIVREVSAPAKEKGGGCSLSASTGAGANIPWYMGLLEWMIYLLLPAFIRRFTKESK